MKAISIKPEYADQIRAGTKTIELRGKRTSHRGALLICSTLPDGHARCIVDLIDCRPFLPTDAKAAQSNYRPGLFAYVLENVRPIEPFPVRGNVVLFDVDLPPAALRHPDATPRTGNP